MNVDVDVDVDVDFDFDIDVDVDVTNDFDVVDVDVDFDFDIDVDVDVDVLTSPFGTRSLYFVNQGCHAAISSFMVPNMNYVLEVIKKIQIRFCSILSM